MTRPPRPRYVMIGGFLGAGKTTAVLRLAEHLDRMGRRVGLITNDQSIGLVDTTMAVTKQVEEAAILIINKCDVVEPARIAALRATLEREFPSAQIFVVSARTGQGLDEWFEAIVPAVEGDGQSADADLEIDYAIYGEGEALLGWLNASVRLEGGPFDDNAWLCDLAAGVQARLDERGIEIAHLKVTLAPDDKGGLAVLNQVNNEHGAELSHELIGLLSSADLLVNLRAEGDPEVLLAATRGALDDAARAASIEHRVEHVAHFRPGQPTPTYRFSPV